MLLAARVLLRIWVCEMPVLRDPDVVGFSDVAFYSVIGSAVRFELDTNPNLTAGDSFYFTSAGGNPLWPTFNGDYVVAGTAFDGVVYQIWTTCIGTINTSGV